MTERANAYLRISSPGQANGDGFERQEQTIREYARKHKIEIVNVFRDQVSGTKQEEQRPAFQEMVAQMLADSVRIVIVEGLDRLAREYRIQENILAFLVSKDIHLHAARTGENVTENFQEDPMNKALVQIRGVFSELEKSLLVAKLRVARERKRKAEGRCEGRRGYRLTAPEILKEIKRLRRKRKGRRRMTYEKVAASLNESGLRNMSGGAWTGNNVRGLLHREKHSGRKKTKAA
jgi:DNA invertase Pin-like site-specific DNA recombinase